MANSSAVDCGALEEFAWDGKRLRADDKRYHEPSVFRNRRGRGETRLGSMIRFSLITIREIPGIATNYFDIKSDGMCSRKSATDSVSRNLTRAINGEKTIKNPKLIKNFAALNGKGNETMRWTKPFTRAKSLSSDENFPTDCGAATKIFPRTRRNAKLIADNRQTSNLEAVCVLQLKFQSKLKSHDVENLQRFSSEIEQFAPRHKTFFVARCLA